MSADMPDPTPVFEAAHAAMERRRERRYGQRVMAAAVLARQRVGNDLPDDALEALAEAVLDLTSDVATGNELDDFYQGPWARGVTA